MNYVYPIIMGCLALGILIYAAVIAIVGSTDLIPRHYAARVRNKKIYARRFALLLVIVAAAPIISGVVGLFSVLAGVIILIIALAVCLYVGARVFTGK